MDDVGEGSKSCCPLLFALSLPLRDSVHGATESLAIPLADIQRSGVQDQTCGRYAVAQDYVMDPRANQARTMPKY